MNKIRNALLSLILIPFICSMAAEAEWLDDYDKALQRAKAEKKLILMDFTGSDWCSSCVRLDKEVFAQSEFQEYASKNLILLEVDFPKKVSLPPKLKNQNEELAKEFHITSYPTVIILDSTGKKIGLILYRRRGAASFIEEIKKLNQNRT
jgi:thioredoxin-related protein